MRSKGASESVGLGCKSFAGNSKGMKDNENTIYSIWLYCFLVYVRKEWETTKSLDIVRGCIVYIYSSFYVLHVK